MKQNFFYHLSVCLSLCFVSRIQHEVPSKGVLEQEMVWMKEHLSTLGSPVVLCHNDLLCKNIIHNSKEGSYVLLSPTTPCKFSLRHCCPPMADLNQLIDSSVSFINYARGLTANIHVK